MARAYTATTMMRDAMACLMDRWSRWCPVDGGGGEIRTRGGVAATRLFESRTLNRSDTPPGEDFTPHPGPPRQGGRGIGFFCGRDAARPSPGCHSCACCTTCAW